MVFDSEAEAAVHMREKHLELFSAKVPPKLELPDAAMAVVPPGLLEVLDKQVDAKIQAALEAERPQVAAAVKGAIQQVLAEARAAGVNVPGVPLASGEGGMVPGSPVTPTGAAFMQWIMRQNSGGGEMEGLARTLTQARAISDVLNPPSIWDRVMQNAVLRSLGKAGLVTDSEMKELLEPPPKT